MRRTTKSFATVAVVIAEVACIGVVALPASAQDATRQQLRQQQRLIQQQQRQIQEYQRQLASQQQTPQEDMGLFGVLGCPRGYTYSWFGKGCYPNLPAPVVITSPRY